MENLHFVITRCSRKLFPILCTALYAVNISAQVHIGAETPPASSVSLTSVFDSAVIVNKDIVDGLLVFNTNKNPSANLYMGLYAWNSVKGLWENIVSESSFHNAFASYYAAEEVYFAANI